MNKISLAIAFLFSFTITSFAQHYKTAAGIRLGGGIGLTVQQNIGDKHTLEAIISTRTKGDAPTNDFSLLAERHFNLLTRRFNIYLGAGVHASFLQKKLVNYSNMYGASLIGGAEFTMGRLNFSIDLKPAINISRGENQSLIDAPIALSARYIIVKRESFKNRVKDKFKRKT